MIYDKDFLLKLDKMKNKIIYGRVTALTFSETPIETIEGRITAGTINIDGASAVRRTCSLTMVANDFDYSNYTWGLNTKFKLEIGVENHIDSFYPKIIWFNQGIYLFTSFNTSRSTNNFTINLSGKDKMCLLNGEVGGALESSVDFGKIEEENADGVWTITDIPVYDIIRNMVHTYAGEPYHNIIINDLDDYGLELLEYRFDKDLFLYRKIDSEIFDNILLDEEKTCDVWDAIRDDNGNITSYKKSLTGQPLKDLAATDFDMLVDSLVGSSNPKAITFDGNDDQKYHIAKVEYGQTAGYRLTPLTYAGDLIAKVGESITSVLDKIKNMLSEFEYFYDVDGQFIFQRKKAFINTLWTPLKSAETETLDSEGLAIYHSEKYVDSIAESSSCSYIFNEGELIASFNSTPNLLNVKNDFSVWGNRKSVSGVDIPVHLRYAIDVKPEYYTTFNNITYTTKTPEEVELDKEKLRTESFNVTSSGYQKTPSKHGLSENWWEVRDWAAAWEYSGLGIPTSNLGKYCPIKCICYNEHGVTNTPIATEKIETESIDPMDWAKWGTGVFKTTATDDLIFNSKGEKIGQHGSCAHPYDWWLQVLEEGGQYEGCDIYFYKPTVPEDEKVDGGGLILDELVLGSEIKYNMDWRELIYQMAKDYYKHNEEDEFENIIREKNISFYPTGQTGYEQYYIDIYSFWRDIYDPFIEDDILEAKDTYDTTNTRIKFFKKCLRKKFSSDEEQIAHINNKSDKIIKFKEFKEYFDEDTKTFIETQLSAFNKTLDIKIDSLKQKKEDDKKKWDKLVEKSENFYLIQDHVHQYWLSNVYEYPETLNFWFDFLEPTGNALSQFSVKNIGSRPKPVNETAVKSIYFKETPGVIFKSYNEEVSQSLTGYKYIQVQDLETMFTISAQGKSAKDRLDELIYNHGYCSETISLTTIPIYYLQPNTRIHIQDQKTNLNGDYIINKLTIPLTYNGTMTIQANKAAENIII